MRGLDAPTAALLADDPGRLCRTRTVRLGGLAPGVVPPPVAKRRVRHGPRACADASQEKAAAVFMTPSARGMGPGAIPERFNRIWRPRRA